MSKVTVTKEIVERVKAYKKDSRYSALNCGELGLLCGTSGASVSRILNGQYDYLLEDSPEVNNEATNDVTTVIPFETLKYLMACEYAVEAILNVSKLSEVNENNLFIHSNSTYGLLKAYLPDQVNARIEALKSKLAER